MYIVNSKNYSFLWCITLLIIDFCSCAPQQQLETNDSLLEGKPNYRLNTDIEPFNYLIELTPHFLNENSEKSFTFDGYSQILLRPTHNNVTEITLHMKDLSDITYILDTKSSWQSPIFPWTKKLAIKQATYDNVTEKYTMFLSGAMNTLHTYTLTFAYVGKLQTDMHGFYRSSYTENNVTK